MKTLLQYIKESLNIYEASYYNDEVHQDFNKEDLFNIKKGDTIYLADESLSEFAKIPDGLKVYAYKVTGDYEFKKSWDYDDYKTKPRKNDDEANYYEGIEIPIQKIDNDAPDYKTVLAGSYITIDWTENELSKHKSLKEKLLRRFSESSTLFYSVRGSVNDNKHSVQIFLKENDFEKTTDALDKWRKDDEEKTSKKNAAAHANNIKLQKKNATKYGKEYDDIVKKEKPEQIIKITAANLYKYYEHLTDSTESSWDNEYMHCTLKGDIDELFKDLCTKNKKEIIDVAMYDDYEDGGYKYIKYTFMIAEHKFIISEILRKSPYDGYYATPLHQFMKRKRIRAIK